MLDQIVRLTCRRAMPIGAVCERVVCSEKELRSVVAKAREEGYSVTIRDGFVSTRVPIGPRGTVTTGYLEPGRRVVPVVTDLHLGSTHCLEDEILRFLDKAWKACDAAGMPEKERPVICTGDVLDGNKPVLLQDQTYVGFDHQADRAVRVFRKAPPFHFVAIDGNHDGYYSASIGFTSGDLLASRLHEAGVRWDFAGVCLGRARVHGADWHLWHPHGGASTRNAVRRVLNERAESLQEHCDVLVIGHYHKFVALPIYPERVFAVAGGTFQSKRSEFANRITRGWDVGGTLVHYTVREKARVSEFSADFYPVKGW